MKRLFPLLAAVVLGCQIPTVPKVSITQPIRVCVHNDSTAVYIPGVGWSPCAGTEAP